MHLAEGLLPAGHVVATSIAAVPFVAWGWKGLAGGGSAGLARTRAQVATATALLFAVTLFPIPVPVVGMTSHMCATPVLALLVGVRRMVVPTLLVLAVQALLFAHGGLTTLGANLLTLGVLGPACGVALARLLRGARVPALPAVAVATFAADLAVYAADALILATFVRGQSASALSSVSRAWGTLTLALAPAQVPLAALEGALSLWLVATLVRGSPDRVPEWLRGTHVLAMRAGTGVAAALFALTFSAQPARAAGFQGLDDQVFAAAGHTAGRSPKPLLSFTRAVEGGELGRAVFGAAMLAAGFVLGCGYAGWRRRDRARAPERP